MIRLTKQTELVLCVLIRHTQSRHRASSVCFDKTHKADAELVLPSPGPIVVVVVPSSDQLLSGEMFCRQIMVRSTLHLPDIFRLF